jgi:phage host-nuclease inhibitor protein Gam
MAAKSIKRKSVVVPENLEELVQFVKRIRAAEDAIREIEAKNEKKTSQLETQIAELNQQAQVEAAPHAADIETLAKGVWIYAEGHRQELIKDEKVKTFELSSGDMLRWYFTKPRVEVEDEDAALKELKRKGFNDFIRVSEEVNKEVILANQEKMKGLKMLKITQDEIFAIVLAKMGIELQKGKRKFKKVEV